MSNEIMENIEKAVGIAESTTKTGGVLDNVLNRFPSYIADKMLIDEIQNNKELTAPEKAALLYNFNNTKKSIKNLAATYSRADYNLKLLGTSLEREIPKLDDDWFGMYNDITKNITKEDIQLMWSKILTNECIEPKSISKRLLSILQIIDNKSAEVFSYLCSCSFKVIQPNHIGYAFFSNLSFSPDPFAGYDVISEFKYDETFVNPDKLEELESLGLIKYKPLSERYRNEPRPEPRPEIFLLKYSDNEIKIFSDDLLRFDFESIAFTSCGKELVNALYNDIEMNLDFFDFFVDYLRYSDLYFEIW